MQTEGDEKRLSYGVEMRQAAPGELHQPDSVFRRPGFSLYFSHITSESGLKPAAG